MKFYKMFAVLSFLHCCAGFSLSSELNLSNGYRNDTLQRTNTLKFAPYRVDQTDHIKINNINLWQIGLDGRLMLPKNFYLTGFALWGLGGGGKLNEQIVSRNFSYKQTGKAQVHQARTHDYQIGLGYLFDWNCWNLGISSGYAYDKQRVKINRGAIDLRNAPIYWKKYETTTTWKGPWVGGELFYNRCAWRCSLGYEHHFAHYDARHCIPPYPLAVQQGLSSRTKSSHAHGNIVFLDGRYRFCGCWQIGAFFKYQNWRAGQGCLTSNYFPLNGYSPHSSATGQWTSYSINLDIGYAF